MTNKPTYRVTVPEPDGTNRVVEYETSGRADGFKGYCVPCDRTHEEWWDLPLLEIYKSLNPSHSEVVCGYCEEGLTLRRIAGAG
jgi:hypothetical protein